MVGDRERQLGLYVEPGNPRPYYVGKLIESVSFTRTNAQLIRGIAPLYLTGDVLDATYGRGGWWRLHLPLSFTAHDLATDGVDFTALPEPDSTFDAACFDPPYIPQGSHTTRPDFTDMFGLTPRTEPALWALIDAGLSEMARVTRPGGYVITKCCDYVQGASLTCGLVFMTDLAKLHGLALHDVLVHATGTGPGGGWNIRRQVRSRRAHSYLAVYRVPKGGRTIKPA